MSFLRFVSDQRKDLPITVSEEVCSDRICHRCQHRSGTRGCASFGLLQGKKVILAVRNIEAGQTAKDDIETSTKSLSIVDVWQLDMASFDSVKAFAKRATEQLNRIDAVIENAGVALVEYETGDGLTRKVSL